MKGWVSPGKRRTGKRRGEGKQGEILREQSLAGHLVWGVGEKSSKRCRVGCGGGEGVENLTEEWRVCFHQRDLGKRVTEADLHFRKMTLAAVRLQSGRK